MANDKAAFDIRTMRIGTGISYGKPASIPGKTSAYEKHRIRKKTVLQQIEMTHKNTLKPISRREFRAWLTEHASSEPECWVAVKRGKPIKPDVFYYLDAVEEALCFGWIDSTYAVIDGVRMKRFSPRKKNNPAMYSQTLDHLICETKKGRMFGEWNDYGRLLDY